MKHGGDLLKGINTNTCTTIVLCSMYNSSLFLNWGDHQRITFTVWYGHEQTTQYRERIVFHTIGVSTAEVGAQSTGPLADDLEGQGTFSQDTELSRALLIACMRG